MNHLSQKEFSPLTITLATVSIALSVAPVVSSCSTWMASLSIASSVTLCALLISQNRKNRAKHRELLLQVDDNIKKFLFNNGEQSADTSISALDNNLKNATVFIRQIGEGNFDVSYAGMNESLIELNKGNLSGELLQMKAKMLEVAQEEKQRSWVAAGLAQFSEIVRAQNKSFEEIINHFIGELVKYIGANQGGVFIVNNEDPSNILLELKGCYAYGRRKFIEKAIASGEGLVGQAYIEGDIIYLTDVPKNYIAVTSGLGEATPRCVILVPLKNNDVIEGVIEVASFRVWKKFEADFLIKIAEILASAVTNLKVNQVTRKLLQESQMQSEQLKAQEEEMRQNMEELNATQEAIARKSQETIAHSNKLNAILDSTVDAIITIDETKKIESVNKAFTTLFGYSDEEIKGKNIDIIFAPAREEANGLSANSFLSEIGKVRKIEAQKSNGTLFQAELAINVADLGDRQIYTGIIRDITERVRAEQDQHQFIEELQAQEEELKQNMEELESTQEEIHRQLQEINKVNRELDARVLALNTSTIMSESDLFGNITYVNEKFCEVSQYSQEELIGEPHNMLRHPDMPKEVFAALWSNIKAGKVFRGIVKNRKKDGSHYWVDAVISPVLGENGKPEKYIGVRYVIEDEELAQKLFRKQLQDLGLTTIKEKIAA